MRNIIWKRRISGTNTWLTVSKNDEVKLLWDNEHPMWSCHQCYNRHDHVVVNKQERECAIVDIAVEGDKRIVEKENEKNIKYQELKREIARIWNMRTVQEIQIVVWSLGSVTKNLDKWLEKLDIRSSISLI